MRIPLTILSIGLFGLALNTSAQKPEIEFPVAELGNCQNEETCFDYCEEPSNFEACFTFGVAHGLIEEKEAAVTREVLANGGPGGCQNEIACDAYCSETSHMNECIAFAKKHDLMPPEELQEAEQILAALERGAKLPAGCQNKQSCEAYCEEPAHMEECFAFAKEAGMIPEEELEQMEKAMELMRTGQTPGGCRSEQQCMAYCEQETHFEECLTFGVEAGLMSAQEAEMMRQSGGFDEGPRRDGPPEGERGGEMPDNFVGPGGCQSEEECMQYCMTHLTECMQFFGEQEPHDPFHYPPGDEFDQFEPYFEPGIEDIQIKSPDEFHQGE